MEVNGVEMALNAAVNPQSVGATAFGAYDSVLMKREFVLINLSSGDERIIYDDVTRDSVEDLLHECVKFGQLDEREQERFYRFKQLEGAVTYMNQCDFAD